MSTQPLVSVIIAAYNSERFIAKTLESVFTQTFTDYEVIVVDDSSTDGTRDLLQSSGFPLRLILRDENSRSADIPRRQAMAAARGKYCALLDADDIWQPGKLMRQAEFMMAHPDVALSHTYVRIIDEHGTAGDIRHDGSIPPTGMIGPLLLKHCFICTSAVMVEKQAWLGSAEMVGLGGFGTEWDIFLQISRSHTIGFIPEVLTLYRRSDHGISCRDWRRFPRDIGAKIRIFQKGLWKGLVDEADMCAIIHNASMENLQYASYRGEFSHALYFARMGLRYRGAPSAAIRDMLKALARSLLQSNSGPKKQNV